MTPSPDWSALIDATHDGRPARDRDGLVQRALRLGADVTPQLVGCSLTVGGPAGWTTPQASAPVALALDLAQYRSGTGPCVEAATSGVAVQLDDIGADPRFEAFTRAAAARGVGSSLSLPLTGAGDPSALNLYARGPAAFDSRRPTQMADFLARVVGALLAAPPAGSSSRLDSAARTQGATVRRGAEMLADRLAVPVEYAYRLLAERSREEGRTMPDLAWEVLRGDGPAGRRP